MRVARARPITVLFVLLLPPFFLGGGSAAVTGNSSSGGISQEERPLHSAYYYFYGPNAANNPGGGNAEKDKWICDDGYYRTNPSAMNGKATCRPCSLPFSPSAASTGDSLFSSEIRFISCPTGYRLVPCTPLADIACAPCPYLPSGYRYDSAAAGANNENNNCTAIKCDSGYYRVSSIGWNASRCSPCPIGFYCYDGTLTPCGTNCTTEREGASGPLQCVQTNEEGTLAFRTQFAFAAPVVGELPPSGKCDLIESLFVEWLRFGLFQGCTAQLLTDKVGVLECLVAVPRCTAGHYLNVLLQLLRAKQTILAQRLRECTASPTLVMGSPLVQEVRFTASIQKASSTDATNPNARNNNINDGGSTGPRFLVQPRAWGQSRHETLATLGVVSASLVGLCVGCAAACTLAITRVHRRTVIRRLFSRIARMHRRWGRRLAQRRALWRATSENGASAENAA